MWHEPIRAELEVPPSTYPLSFLSPCRSRASSLNFRGLYKVGGLRVLKIAYATINLYV